MRAIVAALLCGLCACADVTVLRYQPSKAAIITGPSDHGFSTVSRPARGEVTGASLADGFPVWVVHHEDGTVGVISAVAPAPPKTRGTYRRDDVASQVGRSLVSWIPGARRFYAGGMFFDERGHVLGYAAFDACLDTCPEIKDMPLMLRDLDAFAIDDHPGAASVDVGQLVEGQLRQRALTWLPWRAAERVKDLHAADSAAVPRLSLVDALALAEGHYAVVDGEAVRSTHAEPVICKPTNHPGSCGACGTERLPLAGIIASDAAHIHRSGWWRDPAEYHHDLNAVYVEAEPGTFLVRRQGAGFQIVAGVFRGNCGGSW